MASQALTRMPAAAADHEVWLVLTSESSQERAAALASRLLERRLAACISLIPVQSLYHWQGQLEHSAEVQLLIKTAAERLPALHAALHELHSYDTPMWLQWRSAADAGYGAWLAAELLSPGAGAPARADLPGDGDPAG